MRCADSQDAQMIWTHGHRGMGVGKLAEGTEPFETPIACCLAAGIGPCHAERPDAMLLLTFPGANLSVDPRRVLPTFDCLTENTEQRPNPKSTSLVSFLEVVLDATLSQLSLPWQCSVGNEGMSRINHVSRFRLRGPLGSFLHSPLELRQVTQAL